MCLLQRPYSGTREYCSLANNHPPAAPSVCMYGTGLVECELRTVAANPWPNKSNKKEKTEEKKISMYMPLNIINKTIKHISSSFLVSVQQWWNNAYIQIYIYIRIYAFVLEVF